MSAQNSSYRVSYIAGIITFKRRNERINDDEFFDEFEIDISSARSFVFPTIYRNN